MLGQLGAAMVNSGRQVCCTGLYAAVADRMFGPIGSGAIGGGMFLGMFFGMSLDICS